MPVSFSNIPSSDLLTPLFYAEMDNSQANTSTGSETRRLLLGQVNDDATGDVGTLQLVTSLSQVQAIAGVGSMLAAQFQSLRRTDPAGEVWAVPVKLETGSAAKGTVTIAGTATAAGVLNLYIAGKRTQVTVASGMTASEIAAAIVTALAASSTIPVTAAAADAVVTLTTRWKGETGNDITVAINSKGTAGGESTPAGLTVTIAAMSGGTGQVDVADLLAAVGDEAFEFTNSGWSDETALDDLKEWMNDVSGRWAWSSGLFGHVYAARRGELGTHVAEGKLRNDQHVTVHGFEPGVAQPAWEVGAAWMGITAVFISADPARPTQTGALVGIDPAPAGSRFILTERNSLLKYGVATAVYSGGYYRIERAVTTYQRNALGQADDSYRDSETMHQSAAIIRYLRTAVTSKYPRHKLADDGTSFGPGNAILTPSMARAEMISAYYAMEELGWVENAAMFAKYLVVERDANDPNRLNVLFPPDYVNQLRVFALLNQFRLQYATEVS
ncbi:phage tail protein [Paraburkholderia tropica]|uniref:phage tail sheath C-terminal domain-containing protein n=1 Tax=Paraburkholderia tropica TaxID=92647 RepID=UPI0016039A82|nr:phage tail sheath C-terminal domain-containing protein [Paraburkholderia tropica]QNB11563.1 phage tail protein [Paraburkholderia tropica]